MAGFWIVVIFFGPFFFLAMLMWALEVALPVIVAVVLACNVLFLAGLLFLRYLWKRSGTMGRDYIDQKQEWLRWALLALRYGLIVLIAWEILVIALCAAYLIFRPDLAGMLLAVLSGE